MDSMAGTWLITVKVNNITTRMVKFIRMLMNFYSLFHVVLNLILLI